MRCEMYTSEYLKVVFLLNFWLISPESQALPTKRVLVVCSAESAMLVDGVFGSHCIKQAGTTFPSLPAHLPLRDSFTSMARQLLFQSWNPPSQLPQRWHHESSYISRPRRRKRPPSALVYNVKLTVACMEPLQKTDDVTKQLLRDVATRRAAQADRIVREDVLGKDVSRRRRERLRIRAKRPVWTYALIAINCSVVIAQKVTYFAYRAFGGQTVPLSLQSLGAKISTKIMSGQLWRLLTPAFLHINVRHLLLNMYALYALGSATEILYGSASFLAIYLGGAVGGNMASLCANLHSSRASVGSSGAVFGLIAAMLVHLDRNRTPIGPVARENLRMVGIATLINLMGGWLMPSVDGWAHFGGFLFGSLIAMRLAPEVVLHRSMDTGRITFVEVRRALRKAAAVAATCAIIVSVVVVVGLRLTL